VGTLTGLGVSGTTGLDGAVTINNSEADVDFRVAGDTDANLLFVDASTDRVGIGTNAPTELLDVDGTIKATTIAGTLSTAAQANVTSLGTLTGLTVSGATGLSTLTVSGDANFDSGTLFVDESANSVGVGTSSPTTTKLQVVNSSTSLTTLQTTSPIAGVVVDGQVNTQINHGGTGGSGNTVNTTALYINNRKGGGGYQTHFTTSLKSRVRSNDDNHIYCFSDAEDPAFRVTGDGNVTIAGSLSKGSGSFKINHPVMPDTHYLVHSFIEGPQADLIYRGTVQLANGKATVNLDEAGRMTDGTFVLLNTNVQCFTANESGWSAVRGLVEGNILTIECQDEESIDTVSWMVIGERCDEHMIKTDWTDENGRVITEPEKTESEKSKPLATVDDSAELEEQLEEAEVLIAEAEEKLQA